MGMRMLMDMITISRGPSVTRLTARSVAIFLLMLPGFVVADQNDARLDGLFHIVQQSNDVEVVNVAQNRIWEIWLQHDNEQTQRRLIEGIDAMDRNPGKALRIFTELTDEFPDFAESWNKRATLYYLYGQYAESASDIETTLALEPRHFGALSGLGLVYLAQNQYVKAIAAFEAVLLINPSNDGVRKNIEMINQQLRRNAI
jgi:tetratricopeptide (TPR) repeat protein